jgi:enolase
MNVDSVTACTILDSRGKPTIETEIQGSTFGPGSQGRTLNAKASVPSGKSTGSHEAKELRDADGGVNTAVANVNGEIAVLLKSHAWNSAEEIDAALIALDGTPDKSRLGANAVLSVSIAASRLFAQAEGMPLWKSIANRAGTTPSAPRLYVNVMNGGAHADFRLPFQEYLLVAEGKTSSALATAQSSFTELGKVLGDVPMGDEGGYSPQFDQIEKPFELLAELVAKHSNSFIALDAAASEFFDPNVGYAVSHMKYSPVELFNLYEQLIAKYPLRSIEDPFAEDSDADFAKLTAAIGDRVLIIGDDFTVTNPARIRHAVEEKAINAVLIKPNQIGSVTEAIRAVQATHAAGWQVVCSHRSGETMDTFIADFAYGVGAYGLKAGGFAQKERMAKYDRLLEIEKEAEAV